MPPPSPTSSAALSTRSPRPSTVDELRAAEADALGKRGELTALNALVGGARPGRPQEGRRRAAQRGPGPAAAPRSTAAAAELDAAAQARARLAAERLDLTEALPGTVRGSLSLVTQTRDALEDTFVGMGFVVAEGPEVESDWHNFEALNMPPAHPARSGFDTLYLDWGEPETALAAHPHVAGADPPDARAAAADLRGHARPGVPQGHPRRPAHTELQPDRGAGRRSRHHLRRPGRHHRHLHPGLLRARHQRPAASGLLPVHRAVGRVRDHLHDLRGCGVPHVLGHRLGRAGRLRDGAPQRVRAPWASTPRSGPGSPSGSGSTAWRRCASTSPTCASSPTTTSASSTQF